MTPNVNDTGIVDLSQFAAKKMAEDAVRKGASYVVDVTEASLEQVLRRSMQHVVVLELNSPRANATRMSTELAQIANESEGRFLLARVDVDAQPRIAQALQVTAVPMVLGIIAGQPLDLWQGTKDKAEMAAIMDQLVQVAAQRGIIARAQPVAPGEFGEAVEGKEDPADPRFEAAYAAMDREDYADARAEFEKILNQSPNDATALAGRASAGLMARLKGVDGDAAMAKASVSDDVDAQLVAADLQMILGDAEGAFARLINVIRHQPSDRDRVRVRLLELFEMRGNADPAVNKARRDLMSALF